MQKKTYYEKLKDPRWQKKRLEVMQDKNFSCEICGDNESALNVHHKEYFKWQEPWEYDNSQLSVLCESCHEDEHDKFDLLKYICSLALLDGANNRYELAFILAGYMNLNYEGILSIAALKDNKLYKNYYLSGLAIKDIKNG